MGRSYDGGDSVMKSIALEYLDEEARIAVTEFAANGQVHTWYPDTSSKEPASGKRIYVSLVNEVIDRKDSNLHMYQGLGYMQHEDDGYAYEYIEDFLGDTKGTYDYLIETFSRNMTAAERKECQRAN